MEKKKKGNIILIVVLIILLLGSLGFIYYGYSKYDELSKKYDELNEKLNVSENTSNVPVDNSASGLKVYGQIDYVVRIIGVNEDLYKIESNGEKLNDSCDNELLSGSVSCSNPKFKAIKMGDIKTKDVYKVSLLHRVTATDASYHAFVIFNDGSVQLATHYAAPEKIFSGYKVKDVSEKCATRDVNGNCRTASYILTLHDGSTKTVSSSDYFE